MGEAWVRSGAIIAACAAGLIVIPPAAGTAQAPAAGDEAADGPALRALWSTLDATWNARDATRFSDLFTVDASFEFVGRGESMAGRATIYETFAARFGRFAPDVRHVTDVDEIRVMAPEVRTVDGRVEILRAGPDAAAPTVIRHFAVFAVMLRTAEGWKIRVLRAYELAIGPGEGEERDRTVTPGYRGG
jgi:uncharacterized protein (TIGR02246 family)